MNKQFPTREKTIFLVCEDVRQEIGDKISLQGVFGGRTILLENSAKQPVAGASAVIPSLTFYTCFHDGEGEFVSEFKLIAPNNNNLLAKQDTKRNIVINTYGANFIFRIAPFPIEIGTYHIIVSLDGQDYSETFNVRSKGFSITKS